MKTNQVKEFFDDISSIMEDYCKRNNIEFTSIFLERKITEEIGEMMSNLLIWDKQSRPSKYGTVSKEDIEDEIADVVGLAITIAKKRNVDLIAGLKRKWLKKGSNG